MFIPWFKRKEGAMAEVTLEERLARFDPARLGAEKW
jgi:hypothetical protein